MKSDTPTYYTLEQTEMLNAWGDYGSVLCNGIALSGVNDKELRLARTGPFVPPISFPLSSCHVVVTDQVRVLLEDTSLSGLGDFHRVILEKVVSIPWHDWNQQKRLGHAELPFNGEPEEYILHNPHSDAMASRVGPLWTWHPARVGSVMRSRDPFYLEGVRSAGQDVFRLCDDWLMEIFVSVVGKATVGKCVANWVTFKKVKNEIAS